MRKSTKERIREATTLLEDCTAQGITHRNSSFLRDMIRKMESGKYMSKGQRGFFDSLISSGIPTIKNPALLKRIIEATEVEGMPHRDKTILLDFKDKVARWDLSEKQKKFIEKLLNKADEIKSGKYWKPTPDEAERLALALKLSESRSSGYWYSHAGILSAKQACNAYQNQDTIFILEKYYFDRFMDSMASQLKKYENPRFNSGDLGWIEHYDRESGHNPKRVLVVSDQYISKRGLLVNDIMYDTDIVTQSSERILKTKPRR